MNCGDIPWNLGLKIRPNIYGRYLQSIGSWVMAIDTMFHQGRHRSKNAVSRLRSLSPTDGLSSGDQPAFRHLADLADVNPLNPPTILSTSFFGVPKMWFHWFILNKPLFVCEIYNMRRKKTSQAADLMTFSVVPACCSLSCDGWNASLVKKCRTALWFLVFIWSIQLRNYVVGDLFGLPSCTGSNSAELVLRWKIPCPIWENKGSSASACCANDASIQFWDVFIQIPAFEQKRSDKHQMWQRKMITPFHDQRNLFAS